MRRFLAVALLVAATACTEGRDRTDTAGATDTSAASRARNAARVANAIAARPAAADSILRAAGYTPEEFERLMYEIAADSAMSAAYAAAMSR